MRGAFELLFFSAHGGFQFLRRLSHSAKTPPFPRAAQLAHPRGAPYSASPNTAGGGYRRRQPHTAKPYAVRRASALTAQLVEMAAFVGVGEAAGKLKAAMLV